tara:strand:- start:220 stop:348 length:129 start_codon:yes stop_codon:yes gene_type:complete
MKTVAEFFMFEACDIEINKKMKEIDFKINRKIYLVKLICFYS